MPKEFNMRKYNICKYGHKLVGKNKYTYWHTKDGCLRIDCVICKRLRQRKYQKQFKVRLRRANYLRNWRQTMYIPDVTRKDLIEALITMPDEAFTWFVLACQKSAMMNGANIQIWPDGMGGFQSESRKSVEDIRNAADIWIKGKSNQL